MTNPSLATVHFGGQIFVELGDRSFPAGGTGAASISASVGTGALTRGFIVRMGMEEASGATSAWLPADLFDTFDRFAEKDKR